MPDFTLEIYKQLLKALCGKDYHFQPFSEFLANPENRSIILRHDVDKMPQNSLTMARIENEMGLRGTYNFRIKPVSWDEEIIREIASMGHEIGYHYEELATHKGDYNKAFEAFSQNLEQLRALAPVSTITMHGSPTSKHDSRDLWRHFNYRELGLKGEPYLDLDFSNMLYLTDTGRRWDGSNVSVRDKVNGKINAALKNNGYRIRASQDIIKAAEERALPDRIMFTIHPQRWNSNVYQWTKEFILQNTKNIAKRAIASS